MNPLIVVLIIYLGIGTLIGAWFATDQEMKSRYSKTVLFMTWVIVAVLWPIGIFMAIRDSAMKKGEENE